MTFDGSGPPYELVTGRGPTGAETSWQLRVVRELATTPNSPLVTHLVEQEDRSLLLRKSLPADPQTAASSDLAELLLDNEIRALTRLAARYPAQHYPGELTRLVGYDFDTAAPFVLVRPYVGAYADDRLRTLLTDTRRMFMVSLFRALAQLAAVGLVHGAVGLSSVCWDGSNAQLVNFEHTVATGEYSRSGLSSLGSGENRTRQRKAPAHPGDDILAVGLVIYQVITGRSPDGRVPDLSEQGAALRNLLKDVFATDPANRPSALTMLSRLSAEDELPTPIDVNAELGPGRRRFDGLRSRPKAEPPPPPVGGPPDAREAGTGLSERRQLQGARGMGWSPLRPRRPRGGRGVDAAGDAEAGSETPVPDSGRVLCPVCLDYFPWREDMLFERVTVGQEIRWTQVDLSRINHPVKRADLRARCHIRCPNPSKDDTPEHYLPVAHGDYGRPIVIGLVGRGRAGKTHLLVAMIHEALRGDLGGHGLTFETADDVRHAAFKEEIDLFLQGKRLSSTNELLYDFVEYVLVHTKGGEIRPLVFFDVAGEDFTKPGKKNRGARFLLGASALLFVDDPARAIPTWRGDGTGTDYVNRENQTFTAALRRLRQRPDLAELPVAFVLAKADELRYEFPVDHWIRRDDLNEPLSAKQFREESRDVYAFLDRHGARSMLSVFESFNRGTLNFVSATGMSVDGNDTYPRGVKPARVLQPLMALLAMTGVIDRPEAREIGW